ncbi:hypothetical protein [Amazonocrinis nigriterrae]|uniref:hypothetical protein n=1 Tax=Amazonocrinis nigriterrae TaxID=2840443 RepID=UPI001CED64BE|nr:hypothetical protein [Amazonocrinis nigriterrae]
MPQQSFLSRYLAGDHENVWKELQALDEIVEQPLRNDALAVARETMRRVKINLKMILHCLKKLGFQFLESNWSLCKTKIPWLTRSHGDYQKYLRRIANKPQKVKPI